MADIDSTVSMSEEEVVTPAQLKEDNRVRDLITLKMSCDLETEVEPRSYSHEEILEVVSRLQGIDEHDLENKLKIAGFTLTPYGEDDDEQACETCMYYKVHRKFCELPELMLPVEPEWSCRLWRI